jgi:hypothetical protein
MMRFGLGAALPGTVIVGRDGRVAKVISGVVNQADLKKQIETMLAAAEKTAAIESKRTAPAKAKSGDASSVPS